jgi:RNA recognition motif-containing protein
MVSMVADMLDFSESTSIPTNPRTGRAVGYAFVDLRTKEEADRAIEELSGQEVQERKVSVQVARKPSTATGSGNGAKKDTAEEAAAPTSDGEQAQQGGHKKGRGGSRGGRSRGKGGRGGAKVATYLASMAA